VEAVARGRGGPPPVPLLLPSRGAPGQADQQVKCVAPVGDGKSQLLMSLSKVTVASVASVMGLATVVPSFVEILVEAQRNPASANLDRCHTIQGNSELQMRSKC